MSSLHLHLFGAPQLIKNGASIHFQRRKTFALLAYLAASGRAYTREALATLLWPDNDQSGALANLRRDLSRLKTAIGEEGLVIDRQQVEVNSQANIWVDTIAFNQHVELSRRHAHQPGNLCSECLQALEEAVALYRGPFMAGFNLPDSTEFDEWQFFQAESFRQSLTEALQKLIEWHTRQSHYDKSIEYARLWLAQDHFHEPAHRRLMQLYAWSGQFAAALRQYQECARILEQGLGVGPDTETVELYEAIKSRRIEPPENQPILQRGTASAYPSEQQICYCKSRDGVTLAYATVGDGPTLVKVANWLSHLEFDWQSPVWRHWLLGLAQNHALVRYDERGCGLSDWDVEDMSFEAWVSDLEAVVEAAGAQRFPLLGISQGGAIAIAYTIRHPEKVSHLILYGTYARGRLVRDLTPDQIEEVHIFKHLIKIGWGKEHPAFRQVFSTMFLPEGTPEQIHAFNELQRISTTPENALRIVEGFNNIDVRDLATQVKVPTLVMHARGDLRIPFDEGRLLASLIPEARFVALDSKNHILLESEPAWQRFLYEFRSFLEAEAGA